MSGLERVPNNCHIITDITPTMTLDQNLGELNADVVLVASNPGQSVRIESALMAVYLKSNLQIKCLATLTLRDATPLNIYSTVLGIRAWDLEGVILVAGDPVTEPSDAEYVIKPATTSSVIKGVKSILHERAPTSSTFKIGSVIDIHGDVDRTVRLTQKKIECGADFFITQPIFSHEEVWRFETAYSSLTGSKIKVPVYYGLQVLVKDSLCFSPISASAEREVAETGDNIQDLLALSSDLKKEGHCTYYTIPPFFAGGARDYHTGAKFNLELRQLYEGSQGAGAD